MLIEPGVLDYGTVAIDRKRIQPDVNADGSSLLLRFGNFLFRLDDDVPVVTGTGDQDTFRLSRIRSIATVNGIVPIFESVIRLCSRSILNPD